MWIEVGPKSHIELKGTGGSIVDKAAKGGDRLTRAHAAQNGVTLGPEHGELGTNFCYLGVSDCKRLIARGR